MTNTPVSRSECATMRTRRRRDDDRPGSVAHDLDRSTDTVRRHARAECDHNIWRCPYCEGWSAQLPSHLVDCDAVDRADEDESAVRADGGGD